MGRVIGVCGRLMRPGAAVVATIVVLVALAWGGAAIGSAEDIYSTGDAAASETPVVDRSAQQVAPPCSPVTCTPTPTPAFCGRTLGTCTPTVTATPTQTPTFTVTATPTWTPTLTATPSLSVAPTSTVIGPAGGSMSAGALGFRVPAGAVSSDVTFESQPRAVPTPYGGLDPIGAFALFANGGAITQFSQDLRITFRYDPAAVGAVDESTLWMFIVVNGARSPLSNCALSVDSFSHLIVCTTSHFTDFEIAGVPLPTPTPRPTSTPANRRSLLPLSMRNAGP
jgi:hypothetical protein